MTRFGSAAILCGGKSSRMGFDKCMIKVKDKLLIEIIAEQLEEIFENIIFLSNDREKFNNIKFEIVEDLVSNSGPIGAIYTALMCSPSQYVFVTACDMPVVNSSYIKYMMDIIIHKNVEGVVSYKSGYVEPLYAFYSKDMINKFEENIKSGSFKLLDVIKSSNIYFVEEEDVKKYSEGLDIFTNLNCVSDLKFLEKIFLEGKAKNEQD